MALRPFQLPSMSMFRRPNSCEHRVKFHIYHYGTSLIIGLSFAKPNQSSMYLYILNSAKSRRNAIDTTIIYELCLCNSNLDMIRSNRPKSSVYRISQNLSY